MTTVVLTILCRGYGEKPAGKDVDFCVSKQALYFQMASAVSSSDLPSACSGCVLSDGRTVLAVCLNMELYRLHDRKDCLEQSRKLALNRQF